MKTDLETGNVTLQVTLNAHCTTYVRTMLHNYNTINLELHPVFALYRPHIFDTSFAQQTPSVHVFQTERYLTVCTIYTNTLVKGGADDEEASEVELSAIRC